MTAWDDYLAAAQRLDVVRRDAVSMVADRAAALEAARADLASVREAADRQQDRLLAAATEAGLPVPDTTPSDAELAGARDAVGGTSDPEEVQAMLRRTDTVLAAEDQLLSTVEEPEARWRSLVDRLPLVPRNLTVYSGFALVTGLAPLLVVRLAMRHFPLVPAIVAGLLLQVLGYVLAWLAVGALERSDLGGPVRRTPLLGGAAAAVTILLIYTVFAALALTHVL